MINDIKKVSVSEEKINEIVERLGKQITEDYKGKTPIFIGLLKGCNPFLMDLLKHVDLHCSLDYMDVSSYSGTITGNTSVVPSWNINTYTNTISHWAWGFKNGEGNNTIYKIKE